MRKLVALLAIVMASTMFAGTASAVVTFDPASGTGFVGKGDVQTAVGWNNKQLQDGAASLVFAYSAVTEQETSWDCYNENNGQTQERERTTTTTVSGVAYATARENSKGKDGPITGFNLTGFDGASLSDSSTEGPPLSSCPNANSSFVLGSTVVGEPTVVSGGLSVNGVPLG